MPSPMPVVEPVTRITLSFSRIRFPSHSALKENCLFHPPVAYSKHLPMEIDRGVTVVSPNFHLVADLYRQIGVQDVDNGCSALSL